MEREREICTLPYNAQGLFKHWDPSFDTGINVGARVPKFASLMYIYIYIYIYTYMHTYTYIYIYRERDIYIYI